MKGTVHHQHLFKIRLAGGKKAIIKKWLKTDTPDHKQWLTIIEDTQAMEQLLYSLKLKEVYRGKWFTYRSKKANCHVQILYSG